MRLAEVRARLRRGPLPDPLPAGPAVIRPTLLAMPDGSVAPPGWPRPAGVAIREAAALVVLFPDATGEAHVLLTERPSGDLRHAGEISLPGGRIDPGDADALAAALREAREEVGLDRDQAGLEVVAALDPVEIPVSGFRVQPFLALAARTPVLVPDAREVAALLLAPLDHFLPGAPIDVVEEERSGRQVRYGAYPVSGHRVWGATAKILGQVGALIGPADAPP
jgi:8-oxo-dGTP pyrophosphatase MutT (NUDIX family)